MRLLLVATVALAATGSACAPDGLAFRVDERVTIQSPEDRDIVTLPLTIEWDVEDFDGTFAVFVDRAPIGPGDELPEPLPRGIYATDDTELVVETLPSDDGDDRHKATIVLIDDEGRRAGESAFDVEFEVEEP